jgi:hypothetical protein
MPLGPRSRLGGHGVPLESSVHHPALPISGVRKGVLEEGTSNSNSVTTSARNMLISSIRLVFGQVG